MRSLDRKHGLSDGKFLIASINYVVDLILLSDRIVILQLFQNLVKCCMPRVAVATENVVNL